MINNLASKISSNLANNETGNRNKSSADSSILDEIKRKNRARSRSPHDHKSKQNSKNKQNLESKVSQTKTVNKHIIQ